MINTELIDYGKCHEYARSLCGTCGIPACDVADIGSEAFLLAIRRSWRAGGESENPEAVARRLMYTSTIDVIRRRNTFASRTIREADDISATGEHDGEPTDDERPDTGLVVSDNGKGVEAIEEINWQRPFWMRLFDNERQKLRNEKRTAELKVIRLGLKDSRLHLIREKLKFSGGRFQTILNNLRMRFALCFQALREWRT